MYFLIVLFMRLQIRIRGVVGGWAFLELHTSANSSDEKQAYAAGFLEGYCYNKIDVCGLIEEFLEGLAAGYNAATSAEYQWLSNRDIVWFNMLGDLDDLAFALAMPKETPEGFLFGERCTGLVKLLPGLKELYTAQTTWNSYQSMLRIQKMYVLNYRLSPSRKELIPGYKMSLSSYPAFVQILEYARAMVANRLARDGCETDVLVRETYFPSYNIAYFPLIFNLSGGNVRCIPQADIRSLRDMYRTMRYNDYKYDPYARCDACDPPYTACNAIAARNDLNPPNAQADIRSLRDMYRTMRYNDYKYDPYAQCDACDPPYTACNAIAARNDLNPPNAQVDYRSLRDMYRTMRYNDYKYDPYAQCDACDPPYTACNAIAARNDLNPPNVYATCTALCDACDPPYTACNAIAARNDLNPPNVYGTCTALCDACDPPYTACNAIAARNDLNPPNVYATCTALCDACDPPHTACNAIVARNDLNPPN
ncbi:putative phospholipase B-like 2, partial [Operophtera brumata]